MPHIFNNAVQGGTVDPGLRPAAKYAYDSIQIELELRLRGILP